MEGTPKQESVESFEDWKMLREKAPKQAELLVSEIPNFPHISKPEQLTELSRLIDTLALQNKKRYVAREVALIRREIELKYDFEEGMRSLGRN